MTEQHHRAMSRKDWLLLIAMALVFLAALSSTLINLLVPDPLEYRNLPFTVEARQITAGIPLTISVTECNHDPFGTISYTMARELVSLEGTRIPLAVIEGTARRGCTTYKMVIMIPASAPQGTYVLAGITRAEGSLRSSNEFYRSQAFVIIAPVKAVP